MRKVAILLFLLVAGITVSAQSPFKGFFKPVDKDCFSVVSIDSEAKMADVSNFWLFRPVVTVSAMQFILEKPVKVATLTSLGTGISYSHFINQDNQPYQNFAANLLVLFGTEIADVSPVELSVAGTITLWQNLTLGAGYDFGDNKVFLLTGVAINFN